MRNPNLKLLRCVLLALVTGVFSSAAYASHFEFCWLAGTVESLGDTTERAQYFRIRISSSVPARMESWDSNDTDDCDQYVDTVIEANLPSSIRISSGEQIEMIQRLWVDSKGKWWNSWHSTDGWVIDDGSDGNLDDLTDR